MCNSDDLNQLYAPFDSDSACVCVYAKRGPLYMCIYISFLLLVNFETQKKVTAMQSVAIPSRKVEMLVYLFFCYMILKGKKWPICDHT